LLRQVEEVEVANGKRPQACRDGRLSEQNYYRWRNEYGGLRLDRRSGSRNSRRKP
jgi:putative transposase